MVSSLKRVNYRGDVLLYLHPFISTEPGAADKYAADIMININGTKLHV
jgi:hypothetical protein